MPNQQKQIVRMNEHQISHHLIVFGFKKTSTGGNCMAYKIDYSDQGHYVLIAQECSLPIDEEDITIALYEPDGELIADFIGYFDDVIHWYQWTARELLAEHLGEVA